MNLKQTQTNCLMCSIQEELKQIVKVVNTSYEKVVCTEDSSLQFTAMHSNDLQTDMCVKFGIHVFICMHVIHKETKPKSTWI